MSNYTRLSDTVSSQEGKAFQTVDGQNREVFELSAISSQIDLIVQERRMLGNRMVQHKVTGASGTGSLTMYFMNSEHLNRTIEYIKTGLFSNLKLQVKNEDAQSTIGKQEVIMENVILASIPVAILDDQSDDPITFDTDFTFDGIEDMERFQLPANYR